MRQTTESVAGFPPDVAMPVTGASKSPAAPSLGLARRIGITRENLRLWRTNGVRRLPERTNLAAVARTISQPYRQVLSAALFDTGYLTETDTSVPRPHDEVLHDAISVLTEATRLTNQPMRQNSSGQWEPDPDPRAALPIDWAEFVTLALAGAAANVGGTEQILAGRPGSWEAEQVRQTLQSTVGVDDEHLLRHRTEPVVIDLWVASILRDTTTYDDYRDAELELSRREEAIPQPDDLPPSPFSPADPRIAAVDWIRVDEHSSCRAKPAGATILPTLHCSLNSTRRPARADLLLRVKSPTTKPTKPSRPLGRARGTGTPRIHRLRRTAHQRCPGPPRRL
jgi:hypothetical protein